MKNLILALVFSVIGGITSVTGYKYFSNEGTSLGLIENKNVKFANYIYDTTDVVVPEGLNFIYTSKKTTPAVVHIRTTYEGRNSNTRNPFEDMFRDFFGERYDYKIGRAHV